MTTLVKRLKEARLAAGLSQEKLGIEAGIEPASASARMNQYENGKHVPNPGTVLQISAALNLPVAYFYSADDDEARLLMLFHRMSLEARQALLKEAEAVVGAGGRKAAKK